MSDRAPYSRLYWTIRSDDRLREVYPDNAHLATWVRLLIAADMAWPAPADVPMGVNKRSLAVLEEAGVILRTGSLFTFHGLDAERGRRRDAATRRDPTGTQAGPGRSPSRAEPSRDETSRAETAGAGDPADDYWTLTGKYPTDKTLGWLDDLTEQYGAETVSRYLASEHQRDGNVRTLLGRVTDLCRRSGRELGLKERAAEKTRITERRRDPALIRAYHNTGQHVEAPDPACPDCKGSAA